MLTKNVPTVQDSLLLLQLQEGNKLAFDALYEKYWDYVVNEAYKRIGHKDHAKDIAQEVFTAMWIRGNDTLIENLPAWLYTVTRNHVFKLFHNQERFTPIPDLLSELESCGERADAAILEKELYRTYEALVASLPDQQRLIFKMRYQEEFTPLEIASRLNLNQKTVRNHLGKALQKLRTAFMMLQLLIILGSFN